MHQIVAIRHCDFMVGLSIKFTHSCAIELDDCMLSSCNTVALELEVTCSCDIVTIELLTLHAQSMHLGASATST